jgi:hypothetical protein
MRFICQLFFIFLIKPTEERADFNRGKTEPQLYLERKIQTNCYNTKVDSNDDLFEDSVEILTFVYHIVYSDSWSVPVLYLNAYKSDGRCLNYEELYSSLLIEDSLKNELFITQQEHPILFKPFFYLHPCKTNEFMLVTKPIENEKPEMALSETLYNSSATKNYTLKWLSFVFSTLRIPVDIKYALSLTSIKKENLNLT